MKTAKTRTNRILENEMEAELKNFLETFRTLKTQYYILTKLDTISEKNKKYLYKIMLDYADEMKKFALKELKKNGFLRGKVLGM